MSIQKCWSQIDQANVCYRVAGAETGLHVLLLHGASFSSQTWEDLGTIDLLAGAGYRVFSVDLPGFGESEATDGLSSRWLRKCIHVLSIHTPVIVSPSMSGRFALAIATEDPELLSGLVAVAPVGIPQHAEDLGRIRCPVLVVWGTNDKLIPIQQADQLADAVQHGEKLILPAAGHAAYMDQPDEFHRALLAFLEKVRGGETADE